jgi:phosphopantothenoylcysteine synthetase/decarboxylase
MAALGSMKRGRENGKPGQWLVAFALETSDHHVRAIQKLHRKRCDLIVVNDPSSINGTSSHVEILDSDGKIRAKVVGPKLDVARRLFQEIRKYVALKDGEN